MNQIKANIISLLGLLFILIVSTIDQYRENILYFDKNPGITTAYLIIALFFAAIPSINAGVENE